jgi:hypothetical protein
MLCSEIRVQNDPWLASLQDLTPDPWGELSQYQQAKEGPPQTLVHLSNLQL